jgi:hypothetical protein
MKFEVIMVVTMNSSLMAYEAVWFVHVCEHEQWQ